MRRVNRTSDGFTIIEVTLFLAISSLMIIIAITSIGNRTRTVQFTDSVRSLESFLERRLALVEAGSITSDQQNCRWSTSGGYNFGLASDGSCIFLGYMFELGEDTNSTNPERSEINVYQMFGRRLTTSDLVTCPNPNEVLSCAQPVRVPSVPVETYDIPWGIEVTHAAQDMTNINTQGRGFGYLRNPAGQNVMPVFLSNTAFGGSDAAIFDDPTIYDSSNAQTWIDNEFTAALCIYDGELYEGINVNTGSLAQFNLGSDERSTSIEVEFKTTKATNMQCDDDIRYLD